MLKPDAPQDVIVADNCSSSKRVYHGQENGPQDFFYVYTYLFTNLHVTLPFDEFTMGVLMILCIAPTQLPPNSWASMQAFRLICDLFKLRWSLESFLFCYNSCLPHPVGWLSLSSHPCSILFPPYTSSYKIIKGIYFKTFVEATNLVTYFFKGSNLMI